MEHLKEEQRIVFNEIINKGSCGINLSLGFGKTLISLCLSLHYSKNEGHSLLICSKTLLSNFVNEIEKFFKDNLKFIVLHQDYIKNIDNFKLDNDIKIVITTPQVISKCYRFRNLSSRLLNYISVEDDDAMRHTEVQYINPTRPLLTNRTGTDLLYSLNWNSIIIDEAHNYTNIVSNISRGIACIYSKHRFLMSGTILAEPKIERILGYYILLDDKAFPRELKSAAKYVKNPKFIGLDKSMVIRSVNTKFVKPEINDIMIQHTISMEEELLYSSMKDILIDINKQAKKLKDNGDSATSRKFSSYVLAMIIYLREFIVVPLLPISVAILDCSDFKKNSQLSEIINDNINKLGLNDWMNNIESVESSRIKEMKKIINKHSDEKIIIFTSFRGVLDVIRFYLPEDRSNYTLVSNMDISQKNNTINEFKYDTNGILLLTYQMGAEGLNLQFASTILLLDPYFNSSKEDQSIGRILRPGQISNKINIYRFISNLGIEKALVIKKNEKDTVIDEVISGPVLSKVTTMKTQDIIKIIELSEINTELSKVKR